MVRTKRKTLKNKPLVEAIFELRWELQGNPPQMKDPHYKILVGRLYDKLSKDYPFHEPLSTADIPDELAAYLIQHRFRKDENKWPLVQIGPGILTLNDTDGYIWEDFEKEVSSLLKMFQRCYPDKAQIKAMQLRYIDAVSFDYENLDIFEFLHNMMKTDIKLYDKLFNSKVSNKPTRFACNFAFPSLEPSGTIHIGFARGKKLGEDAIIWETRVQSDFEEEPLDPKNIVSWIKKAHKLSDEWFFAIIDGELFKRFE